MLAYAHISSLGYLCLSLTRLPVQQKIVRSKLVQTIENQVADELHSPLRSLRAIA